MSVTGVSTLGPVGNVKITGGSAYDILQTDGTGNLNWTPIPSLTITNDDFIGDGATTNFTLSVTPTNENYTFVSLAGTFQPRTTYTVSGDVLTFSSPPPDTAPIEVTTLSAPTVVISSVTSVINGNSNVNIATSGGNVTTSVAGNANVFVVTGTGANISGTLSVSGVSNLGPVGNVIITGGTSGQYLQTNGSGVLSWQSISTSGVSNGTSNVSIPSVNGNVNKIGRAHV